MHWGFGAGDPGLGRENGAGVAHWSFSRRHWQQLLHQSHSLRPGCRALPCPAWGSLCDLAPAQTCCQHRDVPEMTAWHWPWWECCFNPRAQLPSPCAHPAICFSSAVCPANRAACHGLRTKLVPGGALALGPVPTRHQPCVTAVASPNPSAGKEALELEAAQCKMSWGCTALLLHVLLHTLGDAGAGECWCCCSSGCACSPRALCTETP